MKITQHKAKEKLEERLLQTLHLTDSEFTWEKKGREIRYLDKLFDIKTHSVKDGKHHFTGLFDDEEMALREFFKNSTNEKSKKGNHLLASLFQLLQSVYHADPNDILMPGKGPRQYCCLVPSHIPSPGKNILTPPPQA